MGEGERISDDNALDSILVTYRPKGGSEWLGIASKLESDAVSNDDDDTGKKDKDKSHPHGTKYKPEMYR